MLVFLIFVLNSKHLHIFVAPLNVLFGRRPVALGAVKPLISAGKPVTLDDIDDLDEDASLGMGSIQDFTWKGLLDFSTCTECGRCQSQCPAWNTEKPLSPKLLIMDLRDHALAAAPAMLAAEGKAPEGAVKELERPLIGNEAAYGVIDPDVLWSCTTCGACVNQCPVDIEHVDHIVDMRRYQVLVESNFPAELNQLFRGLEGKGNPWNMSAQGRMDWAKGLDFEVPVVGESLESAAPAPTRTAPRRPRGQSPSCSTWPTSPSACWATARPAPATRHVGPATSSSTRAWRHRTSRRSPSIGSSRSSPRARTASTP
jgi:ferredoxin